MNNFFGECFTNSRLKTSLKNSPQNHQTIMFQFISFLIKSKFLISSLACSSLMNSNAPALSKSIFRSWLKHLKPKIFPITHFKRDRFLVPLRAEKVPTDGKFFSICTICTIFKCPWHMYEKKMFVKLLIGWINAWVSFYRIFPIILAQLFFVLLSRQTPTSYVGTDTTQKAFCVDPLKRFR